jgi:hypothetical protein
MRRRLTVIALVAGGLCLAATANAHPLRAIGLRYGFLKATTSQKQLTPYSHTGQETPWGFLLGGYLDWQLPGRGLGITTEVSYLQKGYSCNLGDPPRPTIRDSSLPGYECSGRFKNQYLSVP